MDGVEAPISVVVDVDDGRWQGDPRIEAAEASNTVLLGRFGGETYVEVPPGADLEPVRDAGRRAKIRCGGDAVPSVGQLASFIRRCRELTLPFKATSGLHHAVPTGGEHGFLNLLAAAVFGDEEDALAERGAGAFRLDAGGFRWRDRAAGPDQIARVRRGLFVAIGSCSAQEPADELRALRILPL